MSRHYITPESPQVSVLIVHDKGVDCAKELIESIYHNSYRNIEVIVVNIGKEEKETSILYKHFPSIVQLYLNGKTEMEFALSEGVKVARGDYLLFLHSVHEVNEVFVEKLVTAVKKSTRIALVCPQVKHDRKRDVCLFDGSFSSKSIGNYLNYSAYGGSKEGHVPQPSFVRFSCNDVFLVSMEFLHKLEENQKGTFFFLDELDMAETVHENRYKIYYEPGSIAYLDLKEEKVSDSQSIYIKTRNRLASIRKHREGWVLAGVLLLLSVSYVPKHTFQHLLHMRLDHVLAFYRGVFWNIFHSGKVGGLVSKFKWK